jgi:hypothetical protein
MADGVVAISAWPDDGGTKISRAGGLARRFTNSRSNHKRRKAPSHQQTNLAPAGALILRQVLFLLGSADIESRLVNSDEWW